MQLVGNRGQKQLDSWAKNCYFCHKHMPVAKPVGWNPANQCELIAGQQKKSKVYLRKALNRKVNS